MPFEEYANDPKFLALSPEAKKIVLSKADSKFGGLSPEAQDIVVGNLGKESTLKSLTRTFLKEGLPFIGALGGGAVGLPGGPGVAAVGAGLGAAGAAAAGKAAENLTPENFMSMFGLSSSQPNADQPVIGPAPGQQPETPIQQAADVAKTGVEQAGAELLGPVIAKGVNKVLAPVAKKMTAGGKALLEKFSQEGMPVSPDVINPSPFTKWVRQLLDVPGTPGNFIANRDRGKLAKVMMDARNEFITDTLKMPKPSRELVGGLKEAETAAYEAVATAAGGKETRYAVPSLQEFLNSDLKLTGSSELKDTITKARKELAENGTLEFGMIQDLMAKKYKNFGKLGDEGKWVRESLKSALEKDLSTINAATDGAVSAAQATAKQATITKATANASLYIEGMLQKATKFNDKTGETIFYPQIFKDTIDKVLPTLKKKLPYGEVGKEKLNLIQKFSDEMMALSIDMARKGPQLSPFEKIATLSGIGTLAKYDPLTAAGIAVPGGFQAWAAHSMMKPNGVMKKWLTTGIESPLVSEMARQAPKVLSLKLGENL